MLTQSVTGVVIRRLCLIFLFALGAFSLPVAARADAVAEVQAFSGIPGLDLSRLESGKVLQAKGEAMNFPRGMGVQACYLVALPLQKTVDLHRQWNAARYPELKVYLHRDLTGKATPADFLEALATVKENAAVRSLVAATQKLASGAGELQLSAAEAKQFGKEAGAGAASGPFPAPVAAFWSNLLAQRTAAFAAGGAAKEPAYEIAGETIRVGEEFARLLKEQPKVRDRFKPILDEASLASGGGKPALYSELIDVEGRASFVLGATYSKAVKDGWQALDAKYYSADGFLAMLTFYQFWPVTTSGGQPATLVWRGDLISSASLAELHGVERLGSAGAMMKEIQKNTDFLQRDAKR